MIYAELAESNKRDNPYICGIVAYLRAHLENQTITNQLVTHITQKVLLCEMNFYQS